MSDTDERIVALLQALYSCCSGTTSCASRTRRCRFRGSASARPDSTAARRRALLPEVVDLGIVGANAAIALFEIVRLGLALMIRRSLTAHNLSRHSFPFRSSQTGSPRTLITSSHSLPQLPPRRSDAPSPSPLAEVADVSGPDPVGVALAPALPAPRPEASTSALDRADTPAAALALALGAVPFPSPPVFSWSSRSPPPFAQNILADAIMLAGMPRQPQHASNVSDVCRQRRAAATGAPDTGKAMASRQEGGSGGLTVHTALRQAGLWICALHASVLCAYFVKSAQASMHLSGFAGVADAPAADCALITPAR